MFKIVSALISYRSRATKVGTGDQALFVRREVFERMGGFPGDSSDGRHRILPPAQAHRRHRLFAQPRHDFGAALGSRRHLAHDFQNVDAQVALSRRRVAGALETISMPTRANALAVMAKAPIPGMVKTRLVPPLSDAQACRALSRAVIGPAR